MTVPEFITKENGGRLPVRREGNSLCLDYPAGKLSAGKYQGLMHVSLAIP